MRRILNYFGSLSRTTITALVLAFGIGGLAIGQGFQFIAQNGTSSLPSVFGQGDTTSGAYFGTGFMGITRHFASGSTNTNNLPVLTSCGSTPSPVLGTGANDFSGKYTTGGTATTCTITFGTAYTNAPSCVISAQGTATQPTYTVSASAITVTVDIAQTAYNYICVGVQGG